MDKFFSLLSLCMLIVVVITEAAPERALVTNLPGFTGSFPSKHYSGYVSIENVGVLPPKNLFYYFVESERNSLKDPVVLWINGGPGCSSMDGFVYEHGPFNFAKGKEKGQLPSLHLNPYSWSKVSNIIYLDSPAGVGFSYYKDNGSYATGDLQTAADTHKFLLEWFKQYQEFSSNPFYIAGESFAGIYIPTLATEIDNGIKAGDKPVINFKGYMIGNAVTDPIFDGNALVPFVHGMGVISDDIYEEAKAACEGNYHPYTNRSKTCLEKLHKVDTAIGHVNLDNILEPCYHSPSSLKNYANLNNKTKIPDSFRGLGVRKRIVSCFDDEAATTWLNDESVRKSLHAAPINEIGMWELCDILDYTHNVGSMLSYHKNLTMQGYRALIYSGDHDLRVPFTGSQAWTRSLGYKIVDEWRAWYPSDQDVAAGEQATQSQNTSQESHCTSIGVG